MRKANDVQSGMLMSPFKSTCAVSMPVSRMKTVVPAPWEDTCQAVSALIWCMFH